LELGKADQFAVVSKQHTTTSITQQVTLVLYLQLRTRMGILLSLAVNFDHI